MKSQRTEVSTITCSKCGDEIYSRSVHDFRSCSCKAIAIDGGRDYTKICWDPDISDKPTIRNRHVNATPKQLFDDWNKRIDKYGKI